MFEFLTWNRALSSTSSFMPISFLWVKCFSWDGARTEPGNPEFPRREEKGLAETVITKQVAGRKIFIFHIEE